MTKKKDPIENIVEWYDRDKVAIITTSMDSRFYKKLSKYFNDYDDLTLSALNEDGCLVMEVPVKWIKITPPRKVSDYLRKSASERAKKRHAEERWRNLFRQCGNDADGQH